MRGPAFTPSGDPTRMAAFAAAAGAASGRSFDDFGALHAWSIESPDAFWSLVWDYFDVVGEPGEVAALPSVLPDARFFPDGRLNIAASLLRTFPERDGVGLPAVIETVESEDGIAVVHRLSLVDLTQRVAAVAAALRADGVEPGDRIGLVMPVGVDALVVTLAALSVGAVVSSAAPEFGVPAILDRFGQLDPVVLVGATAYRWNGREHHRAEHLRELRSALPSVRAMYVVGDDEVPGARALSDVVAEYLGTDLDPVDLPFDHPAYVLFSSGTTGKPKCLIHRAGGVLLKHLVEQALHCDVRPGDRVCFYTTTGWMMWNWAVSLLASGATLVLHNGAPNYPSVDALFDVASLTQLTHLGVGARLLDSMRADDVDLLADRDLEELRMVMVTGSPLSAATAQWLVDELGPRVMPHPISGGTDLVGCFLVGDPSRPVWAGELPGAALGLDVDVVDDEGTPITDDTPGELVCRNAFPTVPLGIWGDEDGTRLRSTYFERLPGIWTHGDLTSKTENGGFVIHGRSDATLNVAGVRIGTGEIYGALEHVPEVIDALAFGQVWEGDTRMVLLVVTADGSLDDETSDRIRRTLRERGSPRHVPAVLVAVPDLPRTMTGKLAEIAVADAVNGRPVRNRDALANPDVLDSIAALPQLLV
jgi:acetoacetyl-CoA synthetase